MGCDHVKPRQVGFKESMISKPMFQNNTVRGGFFLKHPFDVEHRNDWTLSESSVWERKPHFIKGGRL